VTQPHDPSQPGDQGGYSSYPSQGGSYPSQGGGYPDQGGYQQAGYPQGGYNQPVASPKNGLGIAALVLGILALVTFLFTLGIGGIVFGIVAIILGVLGRKRAKRGEATNGGMSLAGVILGVLGLLGGIATAALIAFVFQNAGDYVSCVRDAGDDQAKIQSCSEQFSSQLNIPTT
jgi:hypothetical protein